jgi:putative DNA primase/helicase
MTGLFQLEVRVMNNFYDFIRSHGFEPKSEIHAGKFIRFGRNNSVSAKLFDDGLAGFIHDWRTGEKFFWFADQKRMLPNDYVQRREESERLKQARDAKQRISYANASRQAIELFSRALIAPEGHPYLIKKKIKPYGIKSLNGNLLIPVYSVLGTFQSIQFIDANGEKKFLKGGQMQGGCHFIGEIHDGKPIYISEGYATAYSVYEDTQCLTIVAFNAGNLINVATDLRAHLPDAEIVIAGDCDSAGKEYAEKASRAINGLTVFPDFSDSSKGYSDFNDYFAHEVTV